MGETFVVSKSGVKVYKRIEYHPLLRGTNTTYPDIIRKAKETFDKGEEKELPKICSENSEDALTWHHFSHLLEAPYKARTRWLAGFLQTALERSPSQDLLNSLDSAYLLFWHGGEVPPFFDPPPSLPFREGRTEVDLAILVHPTAVIFVEAKYESEISTHSIHSLHRDQIIRNIDIGTHHAKQHGYKNFSLILVADPKLHKSKAKLDHYKNNPQNILHALPHRQDLKNTAESLSRELGYLTWDQLPPH